MSHTDANTQWITVSREEWDQMRQERDDALATLAHPTPDDGKANADQLVKEIGVVCYDMTASDYAHIQEIRLLIKKYQAGELYANELQP